jgi:paraquat-inducible protein B
MVTKAIAVGLGLVLLVGLGAIALGPGHAVVADIDAQRHLIDRQLATTRTQLDLQQQVLATQKKQLRAVRTQLRIARRTADDVATATRATLDTRRHAARQLQLSETLIAIARTVERIAQATLRHAASLDHKTGPTVSR